MLFWTDNRNQPRRINIEKANPTNQTSPTYYINEDQISVAKYYPHKPISLIGTYPVNSTIVGSGGGTTVDPAPFSVSASIDCCLYNIIHSVQGVPAQLQSRSVTCGDLICPDFPVFRFTPGVHRIFVCYGRRRGIFHGLPNASEIHPGKNP